MDWKRIMNKRDRQADRKKAEAAQVQETAVNEEIRQLLTQLLPEINLRLLLAMETTVTEFLEMECGNFIFFPARLLWVEAVTVTACQTAPLKEQSKKPGVSRIWKHLTGMWNNPHSFKK